MNIDFGDQGTNPVLAQLIAEIDEGYAADATSDLPARPVDWSASPGDEGERHLIFTLGETDYAIPAGQVLEIGRPLNTTPVPNVPDWILGLANVRGDIVPVVDLRGFLGLEPGGGAPQNRMVVVRADQEELTTSLLVDRVKGIRTVPSSSMRTPMVRAEGRVGAYLRGVAEQEGRLVVFLDLDRLLLSSEMRQPEAV
jgi:chemotaxis signal transduction protein